MSSEENPVASVYCGGCGAQIEASAKFCRGCGADQSQFADSGTEAPRPESGAGTSELGGLPDGPMQPPASAPAGAVGATVSPPAVPAAAATSSSNTTLRAAPLSPAPTGRGSILASPWRTPAGHRRSVAWIYYALIAVGGLILGLHHPAFLLVAFVAGLYSTYLFRGGRFVIWFW